MREVQWIMSDFKPSFVRYMNCTPTLVSLLHAFHDRLQAHKELAHAPLMLQ